MDKFKRAFNYIELVAKAIYLLSLQIVKEVRALVVEVLDGIVGESEGNTSK